MRLTVNNMRKGGGVGEGPEKAKSGGCFSVADIVLPSGFSFNVQQAKELQQ